MPASAVPSDPAFRRPVFNDDLLFSPGDLRYAKEQFREILLLLDNGVLALVFFIGLPISPLSRRNLTRA
jgi:hypothetical protein